MRQPDVLEDLTEEERYLFAILEDESGVDLAEFTWTDFGNDDNIFRLWPFQWTWYRDDNMLQIDHSGRSIGKTLSMQVRAFVFPFKHPGQELLVTAPELNHLEQITTLIENRFLDTRLGKEMLVKDRSRITHKPFQAKFANGARIIGRIPQRDGRGVKGCVGEGTIVLTDRGCLPVEQVEVGDRVWTHKQRWVPVLEVQEFEDEAFRVKGQGVFELIASEGHRFFGRRNRNGSKQKRDLASLQWAHVSDMENFYWASPIRFDESVPVPVLDLDRGEDVAMDESFWWLVGRYLADGFLTSANGKSGKVRYRVNFCVHPDKQDEVEKRICNLGLHFRVRERDHSSANVLEVSNVPWAVWLEEYFGKKNDTKTLPAFVLTLPESYRHQVLDGYLSGDGHFNEDRERWTASSASRGLIVGMKLLSQTLGWSATMSRVQPKVTEIMGIPLKSTPKLSWRLMISRKGTDLRIGEFSHAKVKSVEPVGNVTVYNVITEDHSYITDGIVSHNTHPLWLLQDEVQDYPDKGWTELLETLNRGKPGAMWCAHGVTKGIRDKFFYALTTGANPDWKVHRKTAIHRPTWNDNERRQKIDEYGGRDAPDYRRNILGEHGDSTSPVFVIHRLMACVDDDKGSQYNTDLYYNQKVSESWLRQTDTKILENIDLPRIHLDKWKTFWCGMDVGWCVDSQTEILTQDGWKFWHEVQEGDETISIDPTTGRSLWRKISKLHIFDERPRKMVHMKGQSFDALTTPNHRWLVKGNDGGLRWKTTESLNTKDRVPLTVERGDLPTEKVFEDEFVELMAWFWTEGTIVRSGGIEIGQSPEVNPGYVERIRSSLSSLFGKPGKLRASYHWHEKERIVRGFSDHRMSYFRLSQEISRRFLQYAPDKVVSGEFLTQLTLSQLELFLNVSIMADGWEQGGYKIEQRSLERIKSFEMACALAGRATSTSYDPSRERWHLAIMKSDNVGPVKSAQFPRKTDQAMTIETIEYGGSIWCPVIDGSQNWLARRNGSVYFTGNTISPSEILVFAEEVMPKDEWKYYKKEGKAVPELQSVARLRLITRISLVRMSSPDQKEVIREVIRHYSPEAFSFDATGAGLNMFQDIMKDVEDMPQLKATVKGYNFGGKILVDFDPTIEVPEDLTTEELAKEAGIEMNTVLYATDKLRYLVDNGRMWLPWDTELIAQFQEGKYEATKGAQYGRKILKGPNSHTMDAARMAVLGWAQYGIEAMMSQQEEDEPVIDQFMMM